MPIRIVRVLRLRVPQHNGPEYTGSTTTKHVARPWTVVWSKDHVSRSDAALRERQTRKARHPAISRREQFRSVERSRSERDWSGGRVPPVEQRQQGVAPVRRGLRHLFRGPKVPGRRVRLRRNELPEWNRRAMVQDGPRRVAWPRTRRVARRQRHVVSPA
jgi:hypothetical protein